MAALRLASCAPRSRFVGTTHLLYLAAASLKLQLAALRGLCQQGLLRLLRQKLGLERLHRWTCLSLAASSSASEAACSARSFSHRSVPIKTSPPAE
jgi:hypothetical protein